MLENVRCGAIAYANDFVLWVEFDLKEEKRFLDLIMDRKLSWKPNITNKLSYTFYRLTYTADVWRLGLVGVFGRMDNYMHRVLVTLGYIHNWPLQPFSQDYLHSFSLHLCCMC